MNNVCGCCESYPQMTPGRTAHAPDCPLVRECNELRDQYEAHEQAHNNEIIALARILRMSDATPVLSLQREVGRLVEAEKTLVKDVEELRAFEALIARELYLPERTQREHIVQMVRHDKSELVDLRGTELNQAARILALEKQVETLRSANIEANAMRENERVRYSEFHDAICRSLDLDPAKNTKDQVLLAVRNAAQRDTHFLKLYREFKRDIATAIGEPALMNQPLSIISRVEQLAQGKHAELLESACGERIDSRPLPSPVNISIQTLHLTVNSAEAK